MAVTKVVMPKLSEADGDAARSSSGSRRRATGSRGATSWPRSRPTRPTWRWRRSAPACCARSSCRPAAGAGGRAHRGHRRARRGHRRGGEPGGRGAAAGARLRPGRRRSGPAGPAAAGATAIGQPSRRRAAPAAPRGPRGTHAGARGRPDRAARGRAVARRRRPARGRRRPAVAATATAGAREGLAAGPEDRRPVRGRSRARPRQRAWRPHHPPRRGGGLDRRRPRAAAVAAPAAAGVEFEDRPLSPMRADHRQAHAAQQGAGARTSTSRPRSRWTARGRCARS